MLSTLRSLVTIIQDSLDMIESRCEHHDVSFPSLDQCFYQNDPSNVLLTDVKAQEASVLIIAAASQLISAVQPPQMTAFNAGTSYYLSACIRAALETNVVEILREEAGPQGMHVRDIASHSGVDPNKLSRIMCYLATHHIFREVEPDVYVNNRISSACDTGKSANELFADPVNKYASTSGVAALITHCADEDCKGAAHIVEHMMNPETALEDSLERSPMMLAFDSQVDVWSWLEQPWNVKRFRRFGVAMDGVSKMQPPDSILKGFPWGDLPEGSVVVDVGGGIGVSSVALAKACPKISCIVQDRPLVLEQGRKHCEQILPGALEVGRVSYEVHDFFEPQPARKVAVFLLKQIIHDWSDRYVRIILSHLRSAANEKTKLVIVDSLIPHSCRTQDPVSQSIPGANLPLPPEPLLANLGAANTAAYVTDLSMYVHFNGMERRLGHLVELLKETGWVVERVYASDGLGGYLSQTVAGPAGA